MQHVCLPRCVAAGVLALVVSGCGGDGGAGEAASVLEKSYSKSSPEYAVQQLISGYKNGDALLIDGFSNGEMRQGPAKRMMGQYLSEALGIRKGRRVNDMAAVAVEVSAPLLDTTVVLDLRLQQNGDGWQLADVGNFREIETALRYRRIETLERANREVHEWFPQTVEIGAIEFHRWDDMPDVMERGTSYHYRVPVTNRTKATIGGGTITWRQGDSRNTGQEAFRIESPIPPGQTGYAAFSKHVYYDDNDRDAFAAEQVKYLSASPLHLDNLMFKLNGEEVWFGLDPYHSWESYVKGAKHHKMMVSAP